MVGNRWYMLKEEDDEQRGSKAKRKRIAAAA